MSPCRAADSGSCGFYTGSFADCRAEQTRRTDAIHATLSNFGGFAPAAPARVLDKGMTGPDVKAPQTLLIADAASILFTGSYDNAPVRATPCWQRLGCRSRDDNPGANPAGADGAMSPSCFATGLTDQAMPPPSAM